MARSIPFTLKGENTPRHLRLDINAVSLIEERVSAGIGSLFEKGRVGISTIRACLWAGQLHENPSLTIDEAGEQINGHLEDGGTLVHLCDVIREALEAAGLGKSDAKDAVPGRPSQPAAAAPAAAPEA